MLSFKLSMNTIYHELSACIVDQYDCDADLTVHLCHVISKCQAT